MLISYNQIMNTYKLKIKQMRKLKGMSESLLAHRVGISQSFYSQLENQKFDIKLSLLIRIGKTLKVCPYELVDICIKCPQNRALIFNHHSVITVCSKPHNLYNNLWGVDMNEKTTVYIEPDLKENVKIRLIKDKGNESLSALINELLTKWLNEQE